MAWLDYSGSIDAVSNGSNAIAKNSTWIYVTNSFDNNIRIYDLNGNIHSTVGGPFLNPSGIFATNDSVFIADYGNKRIVQYDINLNHVMTEFVYTNSSGFVGVNVGISSINNKIYVVDVDNEIVKVFNMVGNFIQYIGGPGDNPGQFWQPSGLAIYQNNIYVTDRFGVSIFTLTGTFISRFPVTPFIAEFGNIGHPQGISIQGDRIYVVVGEHLD